MRNSERSRSNPQAANSDVEERQTEILKLLRQRGFVSVEHLANAFEVSGQRIRRDLNYLDERGLVIRYHGGAGSQYRPTVVGDKELTSRFSREKRRVATVIAGQIPDGATVFIDIGTTMEALTEALLDHQQLTVLTNYLSIVTILSRRSEFQIILAGGLGDILINLYSQ